jgi:hydrogenase nickel incorporation protein HypA/HybF
LHEYILADRVLQSAFEYMDTQKLAEIHRIDVDVGELLGLENESLRSAFGVLSKGTKAESCKLKIKRIKGSVECNKCGYVGALEGRSAEHHQIDPAFQCPKCGVPVAIKSGNDLKITRIL